MAVGKPNPIGASTGANDYLADDLITHAVNLERLKASEVQKIFAMLQKVQGDLVEQLNSLDPTAVGGKTQANRLLKLFKNTQATIRANYRLIAGKHADTLTDVADLEVKAVAQAVGKGTAGYPKVGFALMQSLPPASTLRALANDTLVMGAVQKEHWARQAGDLVQRFQDQMREGILAGEGVQDLTRRVRGSRANGFKDGIMHLKRYQAEALVRTSVQAVSNAARDTTIQANADIFNGTQWLSTLDSRTSDTCKALSGLRWDNNKKPIGHSKRYQTPPAHWNCRSVMVPVTKSWGELSKNKKMVYKSGDFSDAFKSNLLAQGFRADQIRKIKANMQSSMDGYVPAEFSYEDWLKRKPVEFQQEVLGLPRWRLWDSGRISFVDLVDQRANPLSLEQLQELIDKGRTSIAKASAMARAAAKAEAEAAAKAAAELAKKEAQAEAVMQQYIAGGKGFKNYQISYQKLKKQGKLDGKSFQEQQMLVEAAKQAIDDAAKLSTIKKKFGDGKKLSPSELKFYKALDADTKADIRDAAAAKGLLKELEDTVASYEQTIKKSPLIVDDYDLPTPLSVKMFKGNTAQKLLNAKVATKQLEDAIQAEMAAMQKLDKLIYDHAGKPTLQGEAYEKLTGNDVINAMNPSGLIPGDTMKAKLAAFNEAVDELVEKQIQQAAAAKVKLDEYANAQKGSGLLTQKKVYADLKKDKDFQALTATEQLAKVDEVAAATKAKADFDAFKSVVSTKLAQNKPLTKGELAKVNALTDDENDLLAAAIEKKQKKLGIGPSAPEAPPAKPDNSQDLVFADFKQVGGQGGSNLGGRYVHNRTGQEYYIKAPDNELAAKVEVLSAKLYKMAGVRTADIDLLPLTGEINGVNVAGRLGIASRMEKVDDLRPSEMAGLNGAKDGFAADAWLANWDVIGNGGPAELNLKRLADGSAFRIDTGGTLFFRAQGGRKAFDAMDVPELDTLRDSRMNMNGATVFADISEDQIVAGVARIAAIKDDDIRRMVSEIMGDDADDLADVLIGRKNFLATKYEKQLAKLNKPAKVDAPKGGITKVEERRIEESGINGYSIATDKDEIEDQLFHVYYYEDVNGARKTGGFLKVRGDAAKGLDKKVKSASASTDTTDFATLDDSIVTAIKGIAIRAIRGDAFEQKDFDRIKTAAAAYKDKLKELRDLEKAGTIPAGSATAFTKHYKPWLEDLEFVGSKYSAGDAAVWSPSTKGMFGGLDAIVHLKKDVGSGIRWVRKDNSHWKERTFTDGKARETGGGGYTNSTAVYETTVDDVTVRYWPSTSPTALANRLEMLSDSTGVVSVEKQLAVLRKLGINSDRATALDREELYLMRTLYAQASKDGRKTRWFQKRMDDMQAMTQEQRLEFMRKEASAAAGVPDITALPSYRPLGDWQQFGHGRIVQYRPDLHGPEWEQFQQNYVLTHNLYDGADLDTIKRIVEGGGHMAPTTDKLRRGITPRGMSPEADIGTGGASYFFTRLKPRGAARRRAGLVWKGRQAGRMDAFSYSSDNYGRTDSMDFVLRERGASVDAMEQASRRDSNETIFKDSLSIYDDLLHIVVSGESNRQEIISYLKTKMKKWPDGRNIEDVVVTTE